jgi:hypothetical protein
MIDSNNRLTTIRNCFAKAADEIRNFIFEPRANTNTLNDIRETALVSSASAVIGTIGGAVVAKVYSLDPASTVVNASIAPTIGGTALYRGFRFMDNLVNKNPDNSRLMIVRPIVVAGYLGLMGSQAMVKYGDVHPACSVLTSGASCDPKKKYKDTFPFQSVFGNKSHFSFNTPIMRTAQGEEYIPAFRNAAAGSIEEIYTKLGLCAGLAYSLTGTLLTLGIAAANKKRENTLEIV